MSSSALLVADSRSVVSEFTIYGQSQAARGLHLLPCLCDRGVHCTAGGASLSPLFHSFGKSDVKQDTSGTTCRMN